MDIKKILYFLKGDLRRVEESINSNFKSDVALIPTISDYISNGGGKRLRPVLLLTSARLCGFDAQNAEDRHITYSCVLEYIHAATLLHDDVIDYAELRRGNPSANVKWGNEASVLVGDYLFSKSFLMVAREADSRVTNAVSEASLQLAEGEVKQLMNVFNINISEDNYLDVVDRKTGSLIVAACKIGAILGDASQNEMDALVHFGKNIGYAFQLVDDVLDYTSDEKTLGKPVGNDLKEGNVTLPLIFLYRNSTEEQKRYLEGVVSSKAVSESDTKTIIGLINESDAIEYTQEKAKEYVKKAKEHLLTFQSSKYYSAINSIAEYIVERRM